MSLLKKLRLKPAAPVYMLGDAAGVSIVGSEEGFSVRRSLPAKEAGGLQQVILFARDSASLQKGFTALAPHLANEALLWVAYPKKSGSIRSDLTRDKGWKLVKELGYVGVSQVSLDEDWSGLWFKKAEALKRHLRATPMSERKTEGINYVARTVILPADAENTLDEVPGLKDFFYSFSFTHKREWAEAIAEAKKPETRARRIARMVEDLVGQKAAKATTKQKA